MTNSQAMTWYNKAKAGKLDEGRVNRAFGILQSKDSEQRLSKYQATFASCRCPDRMRNANQPCKHMIARMMQYRAAQDEQEQPKEFTADALKELALEHSNKTQWATSETIWLVEKQYYLKQSEYGVVRLCKVDASKSLVFAMLTPSKGWMVSNLFSQKFNSWFQETK